MLFRSVWEWTNTNCNRFADADDILTVARAINMGNPNATGTPVGMPDRKDWLAKTKRVLGIGVQAPRDDV